MRYSDNIDYLVASILYLGTHEYYWARSATNMARELSLDEEQLERVFDGFPGIYRRSHRTNTNGKPYYALQARYAQRKGGDTADPEEISYIAPLDTEKVQLLFTFVLQAAQDERNSSRAWISNGVSIAAALIAATAAVTVAVLKGSS